MRSWDYVKVGVWFNMIDTSDAPGDRLENYGLLRTDGSEKPAYRTFAAMSAAAGEGRPPETTDASPAAPPTPTAAPAADEKATGVSLRVKRMKRAIVVRGSGPRRGVVTIRAYRYIQSKKRFAARPSYRIALRVDRSGRFKRSLRKARLRQSRWKFTAVVPGSGDSRRPRPAAQPLSRSAPS